MLNDEPVPTRLTPRASLYQLVAEPELLVNSTASPTQTVSCVAVNDGAATGDVTEMMLETVELQANPLSVTTTE